MTTVYLTDARGNRLKSIDVGGFIMPSGLPGVTPEELKQHFDNLPSFKCRDDDVILLSYPKTGTHWLNEIVMMLLNKSAEKPVRNKMMTMLEFQTQDRLDTVPSPRCLNTHVQYKYLPKELREKQLRTVLVVRNPKDTLVSFYHQLRGVSKNEYRGEWGDWFQMYMKGKMNYGIYTDYLKGFEKAMVEGIGFPFHILHYEDLKLNGLEEVRKLALFLKVGVDEELCKKIIDECSFEKMAKAKHVSVKQGENICSDGFKLFRKGQIGDWKNWFTVSQNEQFDQYWDREMADSKLAFTYTQNK